MSATTAPLDGDPAADGAASPGGVPWADPARAQAFERWLDGLVSAHQLVPASLRPASTDASFRRYFRVDGRVGSRIVMDSPPQWEDARRFVQVASLLRAAGLESPEVFAWDEAHGFLLLSDLGARTMMQALDPAVADRNRALYIDAIEVLVAWQCASSPNVLPVFDADMMRREMELFPQWYIERHRGLAVDPAMRRTLDAMFDTIIAECLAWPSVYVHADFMPRNLMLQARDREDLPPRSRLGVLDFQDAVFGPITYDIASLMRDAFLSWDEAFVIDMTVRYWERARAAGLPVGTDFGDFYRAVEWMGLQRHLRIAGVFARLSLRDGKPHYLADAPRFIGYIRATASRYGSLRPLLRLIDRIEGTAEPVGYAFGRV